MLPDCRLPTHLLHDNLRNRPGMLSCQRSGKGAAMGILGQLAREAGLPPGSGQVEA